MAQLSNPLQLLNTSWTLHRLSPLHHGKEFQTLLNNAVALKTYAARLRDQLTGDIFGDGAFQIGANATGGGDDALSKTGALKECTWETISGWSQLEPNSSSSSRSADSDPDSSNENNALGILIVLEYEHTTYKVALLARPRSEEENEDKEEQHTSTSSTFLPLLLTRLPNPLRQTFISFLSANFDTYCSLLRLPSNFLCAGLGTYLRVLLTSAESVTTSRSVLETLVKEIQLTLSFSPSIAPALRTLNITIPRQTLVQFILDNSHTNNRVSTDIHGSNPFLTCLNAYLEKHLAMKLDLNNFSSGQTLARQHVRLTKVACGGFVLGAEGKIKLVVANPDSETVDGREQQDQDRMALRASEELLQTAIRRAVTRE